MRTFRYYTALVQDATVDVFLNGILGGILLGLVAGAIPIAGPPVLAMAALPVLLIAVAVDSSPTMWEKGLFALTLIGNEVGIVSAALLIYESPGLALLDAVLYVIGMVVVWFCLREPKTAAC